MNEQRKSFIDKNSTFHIPFSFPFVTLQKFLLSWGTKKFNLSLTDKNIFGRTWKHWKTWTINIQLFGRQPFLHLPFGIYSNFIPSFQSCITYFNLSNLANKAILLTGHLFSSVTSCIISEQNLIHREDISFHSINYVISLVKDRQNIYMKETIMKHHTNKEVKTTY